MSRASWLTLLVVVVLAAVAAQFLAKFIGPAATGVLIGAVLVLILVGQLVANDHPLAARLAANRLTRPVVRLACRLGALPLPAPPAAARPGAGGPAVRTPAEFDALAARLKDEVLGQDAAVDAAVAALRRSLTLRARAGDDGTARPAAVLLLAGGDGLGKRTLLEAAGRAVFPAAPVAVVDLPAAGDLHATLARAGVGPGQTVILEHLDAAGPAAVERVRQALESGEVTDAAGAAVRLGGCLVGLTATDAGGLGPALLAAAGAPVRFAAPDADAVARVVVRLMADECSRYRLALDYADETVVARLVAGFDPLAGFRDTAARVRERLAPEIEKAIEHRHDRLALVED